MISLIASAAFVGLVHSLAPGHWLPVVLLTKSRRWSMRTAILGAVVAASGHVMVSVGLGILSILLGSFLLDGMEEQFERYAGVFLMVFGLLYAGYAWVRHSKCNGDHSHHGPSVPKGSRAPFLFLFSLGLSPCVAVLPVFAAASIKGAIATMFTMLAFSVGVLSALIGATVLASAGLMKLDHPILEHYGDVITGVCVALMGVVIFFFMA